jgi:protocatechuate 3,4-dioxygenase beta subunit
MIVRILAVIIATITLVACGRGQEVPSSAPTRIAVETAPATQAFPAVEETTRIETVAIPKPTATIESTAELLAEEAAPATATVGATITISPPTEEPTEINTDEVTSDSQDTVKIIEPIEVTYFTPSQTEGPYYPVSKPADKDNDLTMLAGADGSPAGQTIEFTGKVYDARGMPIEGITIEIWQTDANGIYLHPGDPQTEQRDRNFQFYGEAITAADGSYSFRTILPGQYEPRPRHIHTKIKRGQETLLTTQIYFEGDAALKADGIFLDGGNENIHLVMTLKAGQDANGDPILVGEHDIVLNTTLTAN